MSPDIEKRWLLVGMICCAQLVLFLGVGTVAMRGIQERVSRQAHEEALAENRRIANQFARQIEKLGLETTLPYTKDWNTLQNMVEAIRLPNQGFICVARADNGSMVCHPDLRENPDLFRVSPGLLTLENGLGRHRIIDTVKDEDGASRVGDQSQLIAVSRVKSLNLLVLAHQYQSTINAATTRLVRPFRVVGCASAIALTLLTAAASFLILRRYDSDLERVNRSLENEVCNRSNALVKTRDAVIFGLAKLAESRDNDTGRHLERIRRYVTLLTASLDQKMDLPQRFVRDIAFASSLHDIGKVGVPDSILLKRGQLSPEERGIIETHAVLGGRCLEAIQHRLGNDDFLELAKVIAFSHHERWDGKGYPQGISGEEIPLAARVVAVADVYDALTTKRPYKRAFSHDEAFEIIVSGAGTQFDPEIVNAFMTLEEEFEQVATELADNEPPAIEQAITATSDVEVDLPARIAT